MLWYNHTLVVESVESEQPINNKIKKYIILAS